MNITIIITYQDQIQKLIFRMIFSSRHLIPLKLLIFPRISIYAYLVLYYFLLKFYILVRLDLFQQAAVSCLRFSFYSYLPLCFKVYALQLLVHIEQYGQENTNIILPDLFNFIRLWNCLGYGQLSSLSKLFFCHSLVLFLALNSLNLHI